MSFSSAMPAKTDESLCIKIDHSIVKVDELLEIERFADFLDDCLACIEHTNEPLFINPSFIDFHLDSLTLAEMNATPIVSLPVDLEGTLRDAQTPDIGCYERVE